MKEFNRGECDALMILTGLQLYGIGDYAHLAEDRLAGKPVHIIWAGHMAKAAYAIHEKVRAQGSAEVGRANAALAEIASKV